MSECCEEEVLVAVCDVLVVKALEHLGKWVLRADRSRWAQHGGEPLHTAYMRWRPDDAMVSKALRGAWDVVPAMLTARGGQRDPERVVAALDSYVHDLAVTGMSHTLGDLQYRLERVSFSGQHQHQHQ